MIKPAIVWEKLPDYTLAKSDYSTMTPQVSKGYDIEAVRRSPERTAEIMSKTNGVLCDESHRMRFFINEVSLDIGISGTYGQGRRIRDLYPQALIMPTYTIYGQSLTQEDYGLLSEFIHTHHQTAIGKGNSIQLSVEGGIPYKHLYHGKHRGPHIAGNHAPIEAMGFISEMPRKHERHVYTPTWQFQFSVLYSYTGIFAGEMFSYEVTQKGIMAILEAQGLTPFSQAPTPRPGPEVKPSSTVHGEFTPEERQAQITQYQEATAKFERELREGKNPPIPVPPTFESIETQSKFDTELGRTPLETSKPKAKPPQRKK